MPWGIFIPADEAAPVEFRLFGQLTDFQEAVEGWVEGIDTVAPPATFFVNEEGKLQSLPLNRRATLALWAHHTAIYGRDVLQGNAVLIGLPGADGETQDVPGELVALIMKTDLYKYEVQVHGEEGKWHGNQRRFDNYFDACAAALDLFDRWTLAADIRVVAA